MVRSKLPHSSEPHPRPQEGKGKEQSADPDTPGPASVTPEGPDASRAADPRSDGPSGPESENDSDAPANPLQEPPADQPTSPPRFDRVGNANFDNWSSPQEGRSEAPNTMSYTAIARRLHIPEAVVASDPARAINMCRRANDNLVQEALLDNGMGFTEQVVRKAEGGFVYGTGNLIQAPAIIAGAFADGALNWTHKMISGLDLVDQNIATDGWTPEAIRDQYPGAQGFDVYVTLYSYWEALRSGDQEKAQSIRQSFEKSIEDMTKDNDADATSYAMYQTGQRWKDEATDPDGPYAGNPRYADSLLLSRVPFGIGAAGPEIAAVSAASILGSPMTGLAVAAGLGASSNISSSFEDALRHGASLSTAYGVAAENGLLGLTEGIPVGGILMRLDKMGGSVIRREVLSLVRDIGVGGLQATLVTTINNLIARHAYDPDRGFLDDTGQAATDSVAIGLFLSAFGVSAQEVRIRMGGLHPETVGLHTVSDANGTEAIRPEQILQDATANTYAQQEQSLSQGADAFPAQTPAPPRSGTDRPPEDDLAQAGRPHGDSSAELEALLPTIKTLKPDTRARVEEALNDPVLVVSRQNFPLPRESQAAQEAKEGYTSGTSRPGVPDVQAAVIRAREDYAAAAAAAPGQAAKTYAEKVADLPADSLVRPENYLPKGYPAKHLAPFKQGAARFQADEGLQKYGPGQSDGTSFVLSKRVADIIQKNCGVDPRCFEFLLGIPKGQLSKKPFSRVDFPPSGNGHASMATGMEAGANDQWTPGGLTQQLIPEAVLSGISKNSTYSVTQIR